MVVDDDPQVRKVVRDALKLLDAETLLAADGEEALALIEGGCPDLVILDLGMPGISGLEVLDRLHARYPHLPLVILSGMAQAEDTPDLISRGARAVVPKPFSARQFLGIVETAVLR